MRWTRRFAVVLLAATLMAGPAGIGTAVGAADAGRQSALAVTVGDELLYCDAVWRADDARLARALRDGMSVSLVWTIRVAAQRDWWLDEELGEVRVVRRVSPDLLVGAFLLHDLNSGIERRVADIGQALAFLTRLERFPVLDRSLLEPGRGYEMTVTIEERIGEMSESWWSRLWSGSAAGMRQEFRLP
ncbi:MAG: DUF4390 domain-containing protein [Mariprofundaceae bacterium]